MITHCLVVTYHLQITTLLILCLSLSPKTILVIYRLSFHQPRLELLHLKFQNVQFEMFVRQRSNLFFKINLNLKFYFGKNLFYNNRVYLIKM